MTVQQFRLGHQSLRLSGGSVDTISREVHAARRGSRSGPLRRVNDNQSPPDSTKDFPNEES